MNQPAVTQMERVGGRGQGRGQGAWPGPLSLVLSVLFRGRKVICAYSIEDIDQAFSTSKLRGYSSPFIGSRPGTVRNHLSCFRNQSETRVCVPGRRDSVLVHPLPSVFSASAKTRPRWARTT